MEYEFVDEEYVELCGESYLRVVCNTFYDSTELTQVYYLRDIDEFMTLICATITQGGNYEEIESMFG